MAQVVLAPLLVLAMFVGLGWLMIYSLMWAKHRGQVQNSVGHAFQELERLVAKPAVEHVVETETKLRKEDEHGGD